LDDDRPHFGHRTGVPEVLLRAARLGRDFDEVDPVGVRKKAAGELGRQPMPR
jgi:hypothetical protein